MNVENHKTSRKKFIFCMTDEPKKKTDEISYRLALLLKTVPKD